MITRETAVKIAFAYSEIEAAQGLLKQLGERNAIDKPDFRDVFGRSRRALTLGVPSGENSHRLLDVDHELARIIIAAHIDKKHSEIVALCEVARLELVGRAE